MTGQLDGDTAQRLLAFIVNELLEEPIQGDDPLAVGAVDSLGIEQLLGYIEEEFGVELDEEEIVYDNFESVQVLAALVDSKC